MAPGRFAFLVHPASASDLACWHPWLAKAPSTLLDKLLNPLLSLVPPGLPARFVALESPYNETAGWLLAFTGTVSANGGKGSRRLLSRLLAAGRRAQTLGARLLGAGPEAGLPDALVNQAKSHLDIALTNGKTYTVSAALEAALQAAQRRGYMLRQADFAVLGATGGSGSAAARVLARYVRRLTLAGSTAVRLQHLAHRIMAETGLVVDFSTDLQRVAAAAHVVLNFDGTAARRVQGDRLRPGAVVCDIPPPHLWALDLARRRADIQVLTGGLVAAPGDVFYPLPDPMTGGMPGFIPAAMAETVILSLEGRNEPYSLGTGVDVARMDEIGRLAARHGFRVAAPRPVPIRGISPWGAIAEDG